ncbi:hypothetical protein HK102_009867, partial [Quaeritorhiza haematococci]
GVGVDLLSSLEPRVKKAKATIGFLCSKGMNVWGWRPQQSIRMYKTVVRSQLEYGLQLHPLTEKEILPLQRIQNAALQAIFSVGPRTSTLLSIS